MGQKRCPQLHTGCCKYKLSPRIGKAASKLCLKEKHNKRTLSWHNRSHPWHCRAPAAQGPGDCFSTILQLDLMERSTSRNQIIVMPDFLKACHLTLSNFKYFLPSILSSYSLPIFSTNTTGWELPLSEGLRHSEVSLTDALLDLAHSFGNYHFHNLTFIYSYVIQNIHRL